MNRWIEINFGKNKKCVECGINDPNKRYHWANISGKYKRDIKDFKRLCAKCHRNFDSHLIPRGEKHYLTKIKKDQVLKIRELYPNKGYTQKELGRMFNISRENVRDIVNKISWNKIKE